MNHTNCHLTINGYCQICEAKTVFYSKDDWLRDHFFCQWCHSIPRERSLLYALNLLYTRVVISSGPPAQARIGAVVSMVQLEGCFSHRQAGNLDRLASEGIPPILALEVQAGKTSIAEEHPRADCAHGTGESDLGTRTGCFGCFLLVLGFLLCVFSPIILVLLIRFC